MNEAEDCGREGLACIDQALAARPKKDGHVLTQATAALCLYREELIARGRRGGAEDRRRLEHCNAVLSIVAAVHFPLGNAPWEELERARGWLSELLEASERTASPS
ncbi:MAG: hypothetical protein JO111_02125 [Caulobacteraceae bacterium]|nr:hypothetical protein [Caulobacteraceae bacterium]